MNKDFLIGAGTGLLINRTIRKNSSNFWLKLGTEAANIRMAAYNQAIKEGKNEDEAIKIAFEADPAWKKLGLSANQYNGLATTLIGAIVYFGNKKIGSGIVAAGAAKVLFPKEMYNLDFKFK
jgi:hypothetical protein